MTSVRHEGSIQVRVEASSAPSVCECFWIANPPIDVVKPYFPSFEFRLKKSESLNIMTLSSIIVRADADCRVGEGHRFVTHVRIKYRTRQNTPFRKMSLYPA